MKELPLKSGGAIDHTGLRGNVGVLFLGLICTALVRSYPGGRLTMDVNVFRVPLNDLGVDDTNGSAIVFRGSGVQLLYDLNGKDHGLQHAQDVMKNGEGLARRSVYLKVCTVQQGGANGGRYVATEQVDVGAYVRANYGRRNGVSAGLAHDKTVTT